MLKRVCIILLVLTCELTLAQKDKNISYSVLIGEGFVLPANDFLKGVNQDNRKIKNCHSIKLQVAQTVDGSKSWHHMYNDFRYGLGFYYGNFNYSKNLNNPFALYGFIGFTPIKYKKFTLTNKVGFGLSFWWDAYDKKTNPYNIAVSMPIETYIDIDFVANYALTDCFQIGFGVDILHFSNGALVKPNKGINIISPQIGLKYIPTPIKQIKAMDTLSYENLLNHYITFYYGVHADFVDDSIQNSSNVFGLQYRLMRELSYKFNFGLGCDITYNDAMGKNATRYYNRSTRDKLDAWDRISISTFLAFGYDIHNLTIMIEPGIYLHKGPTAYFPKYYQRVGLRYDILKHCFAQLSLRAYNWHVADYIEMGIGLKFSQR